MHWHGSVVIKGVFNISTQLEMHVKSIKHRTYKPWNCVLCSAQVKSRNQKNPIVFTARGIIKSTRVVPFSRNTTDKRSYVDSFHS